MKKLLKILVPIFFFFGIGCYVSENTKQNDEVVEAEIDEKEDAIVYNTPSINEMPDPTKINERIRKEKSKASSIEKNITDSLIIDFLIKQEIYNNYIVMMSSKTMVSMEDQPKPKPRSYYIINKLAEKYRAKILSKDNSGE